MRKFILFFLFAAVHTANAQVIKATSDAFKGYINNINDNGSNTLTINDNSFLLVTTKFGKPDATLTLLDTKYNTIWQTDEMENYIAAGLLDGNILVISAKGAKERSRFNVKTLTATLLDKKSGKIIAEKQIPAFTDKTTTDVSLLTDSVGNCKALLLRSTNQRNGFGGFSFNGDLDFAKTNNLQLVTFDKDMNVQQQTISLPELTDAQFVANAAGDNNAIYFAYIISNNIIVKKYNTSSMKIEGSIKASLDFDNDVRPITKTFLIVKNNVAFISGKLDEKRNSKSTFIIGKFNFNTNKGNLVQELEDRSYLKDADARGKNFESIQAFVYKDKFVIVKEAHAVKGGGVSVNGSSTSTYFDFGPVFVSVYNSLMHKVKDFTTNEEERIYYYVPSAGATLNGNKLYVFFNNNNWKLNSHSKYQVINLDNLSMSADNEIELDHNLNTLMYAPCIQWFGNNVIIPLTGNAHLLGGKVQTSFATVEFK